MKENVPLNSPPYPSAGATTGTMFNHLEELRDWVDQYRGDHNLAVGSDVIPAIKTFPTRRVYALQPVPTLYSHFMMLRRIREGWDHVVRVHENNWEGDACVREQIMLLQAAAVLLNSAFVPYEQQEAAGHNGLTSLHQIFARLSQDLARHLEPDTNDPTAAT